MASNSRQRATLWLAALLGLLLATGASPAAAATATDRPLLFSFDGGDSTAGRFVKPNKIAIDNSTGDVYVSEGVGGSVPEWRPNEAVSRFNADGVAASFSALGTSSLFGAPDGNFGEAVSVAIDNSGGLNQGRLYVLEGGNRVLDAFQPDGTFLWRVSGLSINQAGRSDVAVDSSGHPWVLGGTTVREFAASGSPPEEIGSCKLSGPEAERFSLDFDAAGNFYVAGFSGVDKYAGCAFDSTLDLNASLDVFSDQSGSGGHVFAGEREGGSFDEYDSSGSLLGTFGAGAIDAPAGIAFNHALDRVYVANNGTEEIEVFGGPAETGTVPDPTIEATAVSGPGTATFHGTVNPQGTAGAYYFEWVEASESGDSFANLFKHFFRSPQFSLPADSSPHAVEYEAKNVRGNTEWEVRLVAVNTAKGLRSVSGRNAFKPPKASEAPELTLEPADEIGTQAARLTGAVNPKNDSVALSIERSSGGDCPDFTEHVNEVIYFPGGGVNSPIPFERALKKLTPSTRYCVRVQAGNSFGSGAAKVIEFETLPEPPSEVSTAFAAPRTEIGARINGRVNPEGADIEYQFEWSEDGSSWTALPPRESDAGAHEAIVVSDELSGLKPAATYFYRLGLVKNSHEQAAKEQGAVKAFTTRGGGEETLSANGLEEPEKRGIELVNSPDKGNQNLLFETVSEAVPGGAPFVAPDGLRARWFVASGTPGSPSGVGGQFQAVRTGVTATAPDGWESRSLIPPAAQQFGGGGYVYNIIAATPDQSRFIADLRTAGLRSNPGATLVRLDTHRGTSPPQAVGEEDLYSFKWAFEKEALGGSDVSDDAAHVLAIDPGTEGATAKQLVDIGSGVPEVVSVMPDGAQSECGLHGDSSGTPGFTGGPQWRPGYQMMESTDANLVYFGAKPNAGESGGGACGTGPLGLYVRDREKKETRLIDPGTGVQDVEFIRASPDGREGYFLTDSKLDPEDKNTDADLYRWDQGTGAASCLTCVVPDASILSASGSLSQVLVSDDLSHAYFESNRQLVPGEGIEGKENLYALAGGVIRFVAALETQNGHALEKENAKLSADGDVLVFRSPPLARLTADAVSCGTGCKQIYRYEDREGSLECISCARTGTTTARSGVAGPNGEKATFEISADGSTVGFVTRQALVRLDVNGGADVYEWRDGRQRMLTDGVSDAQAGSAAPGIRGVDADGSNIFFSVAQPGLTGFELDHLSNLYDGRIGGGFSRPNVPARCSEDSCQGPLQAAPATESAASSVRGRGNPKSGKKPGRCPKGKTRRHGRCVKKPVARKQRHRGKSDHVGKGGRG